MAIDTQAALLRELNALPGLKHFLRLARRGKADGASDGELRCRQIAEALVLHVPGIDGNALDGLESFAWVCKSHPETARELLNST